MVWSQTRFLWLRSIRWRMQMLWWENTGSPACRSRRGKNWWVLLPTGIWSLRRILRKRSKSPWPRRTWLPLRKELLWMRRRLYLAGQEKKSFRLLTETLTWRVWLRSRILRSRSNIRWRQRTNREGFCAERASALRLTYWSVQKRWSRRMWMFWYWIPLTDILPMSFAACICWRKRILMFRWLPETWRPGRRPERWSRRGQMRWKSVLVPAPSVPRVWYPASAFRRSVRLWTVMRWRRNMMFR